MNLHKGPKNLSRSLFAQPTTYGQLHRSLIMGQLFQEFQISKLSSKILRRRSHDDGFTQSIFDRNQTKLAIVRN